MLGALIVFAACDGGSAVPQDAEAQLAAAFGGRPLVARLSGLPHQRCPESRTRLRIDLGRCQPLPGPDDERFELAVESSRRVARANAPETRRARALTSLLWTDGGESLDRSIAELRVLAVSEAASATDLAAALLFRASVRDDPADLILALDVCDRTLAAAAATPALLFNRALALDALALDAAALAAWKGYLALEDGEGWRVEATHRLRAAQRRVQGADGDPAGSADDAGRSLRESVDAWAAAVLRGDRTATQPSLREILRIAGLGDTETALLAGRMLDSIERAEVRGAAGELAAAQRLLASGLEAYGEGRFEPAAAALARATTLLREHDSPFALRAALSLAIVHFQRGEGERARHVLDSLLAGQDWSGMPRFEAQVLWMRGLVEQKEGRPANAIGHYRTALARLPPSERQMVSGLRVLLAEALQDVGDQRGAWHQRHAALLDRRHGRDPRTLHNLLYEITRSLRSGDHPEVAAYFHDEMVDNCGRLPQPACAEALLFRARTSIQLGDDRRAAQDLDGAFGHLATMPDNELRQRTEGEIHLSRAELLAAGDPEDAATALSMAESSLRRLGEARVVADLLAARARLRLAQGDWQEAEADLEATLAEIVRLPEVDLGGDRRRRFRSLLDELGGFHVDRRDDSAAALEWLERFSNDEWRHSAPASALAGATSSSRPGADEVVLRFGVFDGVLHRWDLRADRVDHHRLGSAAGEVERQLERFGDAVAARDEAAQKESLRALHGMLLAGVDPRLPPGGRLVVVADRFLHRVPWPALLDDRGRYLVERAALVVAPSVAWYLEAGQRSRVRPAGPETAPLLVAEPAASPAVFGHLAPLPAARGEVEEIAVVYGGGVVLGGAEATVPRFLEELRGAEILHFAGHAIAEGDPLAGAGFVLAPSSGDPSGLLSVRQVLDGPPLPLRLAILASCSLGGGARDDFPPMVRAFLHRGARSVVAVDGELDDAIGQRLFVDFHRRLVAGEPPAVALRSAQLALKHLEPGTWGRVRLLGAT